MNYPSITLLKGRTTLITLLLVSLSIAVFGQAGRPDAKRPEPRNTGTTRSMTPPTDSIVQERLVQLALEGPTFDISNHQNRIAEFKVKTAKKSWFNLLALSLNYNDQTFAKQIPGQIYVYPKYFFGLTIPVGTIVSKGAEIKAAKEDLKIAKDNQEILARSIRAEVLTKYKQYLNAKALLNIEEQVNVEVQTTYMQVEADYKKGLSTLQLFSEAVRNNAAESAKVLNAKLQLDLVKIDIEKIIGVSLDTVTNH